MTGRELVPVDPVRYERDRVRVEASFWDKVRRTMGRVPFVEDALACYYCALDPATPFQAKAILIGALAYFVVPADMIPDFIASLGFVDDAAVIAAAVKAVAPEIRDRHRAKARVVLGEVEAEAPRP